jgi:hypothetical protein
MRWIRWAVGGLAAVSVAGALATTGLGDGGESLRAVRVATHEAPAPPPRVSGQAKAASLFKVFYKETNTLSVPSGVTPYRLGSCPRGGAVLSAWHIRIGEDKSGLVGTGSSPAGVREMDYVVTNTTGGAVNGRLGLICIK